MKLLVDMNLSPSWVDRLARQGFEAVHWSTVGAATAPDDEILAWANEHHFVLITKDLDFSAIMAAGTVDGPSVVQAVTGEFFVIRIEGTENRRMRSCSSGRTARQRFKGAHP